MPHRPLPTLPPRLRGRHPLLGFYFVGVVAITIGMLVVIILNLATPLTMTRLAMIQETMRQAGSLNLPVWVIFVIRFVLILFLSYLPIIYALSFILRPVHQVIMSIQAGRMPDKDLWDQAGRRLLNIPFRCVHVSIGLWILMPAVVFHYIYFAGIVDYKTALILSVRSSMVGLIASTIASHHMESHSRRHFIPFFFPEGGLSSVTDVVVISIKKRIGLVYFVGCLVPMIILLVTLVTLQWELAPGIISSADYGKGILIFACVLMVYVLIATSQLNRLASRAITDPLHDIIKVLKKVRQGLFKIKVPVVSNDEIGYTAETINEMTEGLRERDRIRIGLELAKEVQQSLLPRSIPRIPGLEIGVSSEYCDETGGDYYDFIPMVNNQACTLGIVLGDVSGHGVSSALLMATGRAFFRQRALQGGDLDAVLSDVNALLVKDTAETGQFMTMFYVVIDTEKATLQWVRAGHDPGCLYDPGRDAYVELKGPGIPLGVQAEWPYEQQQFNGFSKCQVLVLGTDGLWETRNVQGEYFGKERLEELVRINAHRSAREIVKIIMDTHKAFRSGVSPDDDITLLIIKAV